MRYKRRSTLSHTHMSYLSDFHKRQPDVIEWVLAMLEPLQLNSTSTALFDVSSSSSNTASSSWQWPSLHILLSISQLTSSGSVGLFLKYSRSIPKTSTDHHLSDRTSQLQLIFLPHQQHAFPRHLLCECATQGLRARSIRHLSSYLSSLYRRKRKSRNRVINAPFPKQVQDILLTQVIIHWRKLVAWPGANFGDVVIKKGGEASEEVWPPTIKKVRAWLASPQSTPHLL